MPQQGDDSARGAGLTELLAAAAQGDRGAFDRAFALLYDELSVLARAQRRRWQGNETIDTTVLVHEAYLKLVGPAGDASDAEPPAGDERARWQGRRHFFAVAAQVMRQVLVNYAERQRAAKRGGDARPVPLDALGATDPARAAHADPVWLAEVGDMGADDADEVLALDAALARLEAIDARRARIVECRFFAGLSIPATADALGISPATVKREWQAASAWLYDQLRDVRGG